MAEREAALTSARFFRDQKRVAIAMAAAVVITLIAFAVFWLTNPFGAPRLDSAVARIAYAVTLEPFVLIWLAASIGNVARLRFFSPDDIGGGGSATEPVRRADALLQNTLEQVVLAFAAHVVLATRLPANATGTLQGLVVLFFIGRLLFWFGYRRGAASRALGFALTFYPSIAAVVTALALTV